MTTHYLIEPVDSWFFKDALPFDLAGGNTLSSVFPPSARTVFAALLNEHDENHDVDRSQQLAKQQVSGPYLVRQENKTWTRLYPLPLNVLAKKIIDDEHNPYKKIDFRRLNVDLQGEPLRCDLGTVLLPQLEYSPKDNAENKGGYKPLENTWVTTAGMQRILNGQVPEQHEVVVLKDFLHEEGRVGLARDHITRTAREGYLYETRHLRLDTRTYNIAVGASLIDGNGQEGLAPFGGEGRMAHISTLPELNMLSPIHVDNTQPQGLILYLLTPARLGLFPVNANRWKKVPGKREWQKSEYAKVTMEVCHVPPGLEKQQQKELTVWTGDILYSKAGDTNPKIQLTVHSAILGKPIREGGWKTSAYKNRPRVVKSMIPAGSLWFCTVEGDLNEAITALQNAHIGEDVHLGRGELAVGLWYPIKNKDSL